LDANADQNGFLVAYLNGTPVTRFLGDDKLGWNAGGGCCGLSARKNVDDVFYIKGAVAFLVKKYGVDPKRVFGMGHSNGAMMTQRLMCETNLYSAAISISGPLNMSGVDCSASKGKKTLAIHGVDDENVPVVGGRGSKGLSGVSFKSEESARLIFTKAGTVYDLQLVKGADHGLAHLNSAIEKSEGKSIGQKAVFYFGLAP
jgi:polyhydroxybutyrate depolymerase